MIFHRVLKPDGSIDYPFVITGTSELTGIHDEALGQGGLFPFQAIHDDDIEKLRAAMDRSARELSALNLEYRMVLVSDDTIKPFPIQNA